MPSVSVTFCGVFEMSLPCQGRKRERGKIRSVSNSHPVKTEGDVPGDIQVLPNVPYRARRRVRDRRDEHVGSSAGHDQPGPEDGLDGESEEGSDGD